MTIAETLWSTLVLEGVGEALAPLAPNRRPDPTRRRHVGPRAITRGQRAITTGLAGPIDDRFRHWLRAKGRRETPRASHAILRASDHAVRTLCREKSLVTRSPEIPSAIYLCSQQEIQRLRGPWLHDFLRRHRRWKLALRSFVGIILAAGLFHFGSSLDRFTAFLVTTSSSTTPAPAVQTLDVWGWYCRQPENATQKQCRKTAEKAKQLTGDKRQVRGFQSQTLPRGEIR